MATASGDWATGCGLGAGAGSYGERAPEDEGGGGVVLSSALRLAGDAGAPWNRDAPVPTVPLAGAECRGAEPGGGFAFDRALRAAIADAAPDWVPLAGFMRILGDELVEAFAGRMLNIHPSLLPRHRGLHTHRAAIAAGDAEHGASVHFVTGELDGGPLIIQGRCSVEAEDDEQSLARRVLENVELRIYPQAVAWACG